MVNILGFASVFDCNFLYKFDFDAKTGVKILKRELLSFLFQNPIIKTHLS